MTAPLIARITGGVMLVLGIATFVPWISPAVPFDAPVLSLDLAYRFAFGVIASNAAFALLNIALGVVAFSAARSFGGAVVWCRIAGWTSALLLIFGLIPATNTLFGVMPLYGNDLLLNAIAGFALLFGGHGRASRQELLQPV